VENLAGRKIWNPDNAALRPFFKTAFSLYFLLPNIKKYSQKKEKYTAGPKNLNPFPPVPIKLSEA